jgi:hypothetical protein
MFLKLLLALVAIGYLGRRMLFMLSAELGRKADLTRRIHRLPSDFHFAVIIPVIRSQDGPALGGLLRALLSQEYPSEHVQITVVTHPSVQDDLLALEQATRDRIHWLHAAQGPLDTNEAALLAWGSKRSMVTGGQNRLFVFLTPTDIVREDFLSQIALKGTHMTVMQGYTALKRMPQTTAARTWALAQRLFNRIDQAGRYHLGLSAKLQPTGWVIHQDVLEKVPMERFVAAFPQEYGMVLERCGYRVHWVPNVVVYQDDEAGFWFKTRVFNEQLLAHMNLLFRQAIPTLQYLVTQPTAVFQASEQITTLWAVSPVVFTCSIFALWFLSLFSLVPEAPFWTSFVLALSVSHMASVLVARASLKDLVFSISWAPLIQFARVASMPFVLAYDGVVSLVQHRSTPFEEARQTRLGLQGGVTSLMEIHDSTDFGLAEYVTTPLRSAVPQDALQTLENAIHGPAPIPLSVPLMGELPPNLSEAQTVLLSHGKTTIECRVQASLAEPETIDGPPRYRLALTHKGASFETQPCAHLDLAFEELQYRLAQRGFQILSCGSCAYFYNPPASQQQDVALEGLCLQGKAGILPQHIRDTVHVLSPQCAHHANISQDSELRGRIIEDWKISLGAFSN